MCQGATTLSERGRSRLAPTCASADGRGHKRRGFRRYERQRVTKTTPPPIPGRYSGVRKSNLYAVRFA